jgi:hypothetical protein
MDGSRRVLFDDETLIIIIICIIVRSIAVSKLIRHRSHHRDSLTRPKEGLHCICPPPPTSAHPSKTKFTFWQKHFLEGRVTSKKYFAAAFGNFVIFEETNGKLCYIAKIGMGVVVV